MISFYRKTFTLPYYVCFGKICFTAFGWQMSNPSNSHLNCCSVMLMTSSCFCGHRNLPLSSRLYSSRNPSPRQSNALSLSWRLPQNMNRTFENGSSWKFCWTMAARPSMDLRISVNPHARKTCSTVMFNTCMISSFLLQLL